jgi:hypothetical protein
MGFTDPLSGALNVCQKERMKFAKFLEAAMEWTWGTRNAVRPFFRDNQYVAARNAGANAASSSNGRMLGAWRDHNSFRWRRNHETAPKDAAQADNPYHRLFHLAMKMQPMQQIADHIVGSRSMLCE